MSVRAFSFGGGVQSTAALVLAARGDLDYPLFIYANVGDDAEPDTLAYVREHAAPFAATHGIELVERRKRRRDGSDDSLLERIDRGKTSVPIPMRMDASGAPGNRTCTDEFKIRVVGRELRARGATESSPAVLGLGITIDEFQRVRTAFDPRTPYQRREYPLIDLEMSRQDCVRAIAASGLPEPPKSACYFCPFHTLEQWRRLRRAHPERFAAAAELERRMQERRAALGRDPVWLTDVGARERLTLDRVIGDHEWLTLEDEAGCEEGFCFT